MRQVFAGFVAARVIQFLFPKATNKACDAVCSVAEASADVVIGTVNTTKAVVKTVREIPEKVHDVQAKAADIANNPRQLLPGATTLLAATTGIGFGPVGTSSVVEPPSTSSSNEDGLTDATHSSIRQGMDSSEVTKLMGKPSEVQTLGGRELWNYANDTVPARWQILIENGIVIGTYTKGSYRFASSR
jgi:hypothetical protein